MNNFVQKTDVQFGDASPGEINSYAKARFPRFFLYDERRKNRMDSAVEQYAASRGMAKTDAVYKKAEKALISFAASGAVLSALGFASVAMGNPMGIVSGIFTAGATIAVFRFVRNSPDWYWDRDSLQYSSGIISSAWESHGVFLNGFARRIGNIPASEQIVGEENFKDAARVVSEMATRIARTALPILAVLGAGSALLHAGYDILFKGGADLLQMGLGMVGDASFLVSAFALSSLAYLAHEQNDMPMRLLRAIEPYLEPFIKIARWFVRN